MPVSISVVVPVYNPGPYIMACLTSLLRQTMAPNQYEILLVDDGSTDGTAQLLDRAESQHPRLIRVIHTANSGWAGRPRNIGTIAASGDYVLYLDADDWLLPHSLEIMHDRAVRDRSDIVVGRPVGHRRAVAAAIFDQGDFCTTWRKTPGLFSSLMATHKLFRRAFLQEHRLRFPEGPVRLEDQIMVTRAYLEAERVSVVGNRPCYVHERRADLGNLTARALEPVDYFRSVRTVVDNFLAATEPGPERAMALTRTLQREIIGRVDGRNYLDQNDAYRSAMFEQVRQVILTDIDRETDRGLPPVTQVRAAYIRKGDRASLERWVEWDGDISANVELADVTWDGPRLRVVVRALLERAGVPLRFVMSNDRIYLRGPDGMDLQADSQLREAADITAHLPQSSLALLLRSRDYMEEWRFLAAYEMHVEPAGEDEVCIQWTATATFNSSTAAAGAPLRPGLWDFYLRLDVCGLQRDQQLKRTGNAHIEQPEPAVLGAAATIVVPFFSPNGALSIDVGQWKHSLAAEIVRRGVQPLPSGHGRTQGFSAQLRVHDAVVPVEVLLLPQRPKSLVPQLRAGKVVAGSNGQATLTMSLAKLRRRGRWSVHVRFGEPGTGPMQSVGVDVFRHATGRLATSVPLPGEGTPTAARE